MNETIQSCLICGSPDLRRKVGYEKDHLVTCRGCSFVFSNLRPSQQELNEVYGNYSRQEARTEITLRKMGETAAFLKKLSNARRVIDIGCGDGELLRHFRDLGCEVYGTEFDPKAEEICKEKGISMLPGGTMPILRERENAENFDLAILTEVIEHINNPLEVLDNISQMLRKGGVLYITTPNFASAERKVLGANWGMICYPEHISYYSPGTLDWLLKHCGYEKVLCRTENISVFRIIQFFKRHKSNARSETGLDPERISAWAQNAVQESAFLMLAKKAINAVLNATDTGSSLIAVYKRK